MLKSKRVLPGGLLIILVALIVFGGVTLFGRSHRPVPLEATSRETSSDAVPSAAPVTPLPSIPSMRELMFDPQMSAAAVEMFRSYAAYPPDSRPLTGNEADVLEPFGIPATPITVDGATCALHASLHTVAEGQTNVVRLFCRDPRNAQRHLPLAVHDATVATPGSAAGAAAAARPVEFNDEGRDGDERPSDNVHTWTFSPRPADVGEVDVTVRFALAPDMAAGAAGGNTMTSGAQSVRQLRASFLSTPVAPARFTGRIRDTVVQGSLMVDVELDVERAGRFEIAANLYDGEVPLGYAAGDAKLEPGRHNIPLRFFGKMFRDRIRDDQASRTFQLVALRGTRSTLPFDPLELATRSPEEVARIVAAAPQSNGPDREAIPPWPARIKTQSHVVSEFSPDEWRSPVKDRRLAELQASAGSDDFGEP